MLEIFLSMLETEEDRRRFSDMYEQYNGLVYYIAKKHLPTKEMAEDAAHEVFRAFAEIFEKVKTIPEEKLCAYISVVSNCVSVSYYRKEKKYIYRDDDSDETIFNIVDDRIFDVVDKVTIEEAMQKLSEEDRNIIELKFFYELTAKEIGKILNVTDTTARKKAERAKNRLKKILEERDLDEQQS